jgi:hypothetical protein
MKQREGADRDPVQTIPVIGHAARRASLLIGYRARQARDDQSGGPGWLRDRDRQSSNGKRPAVHLHEWTVPRCPITVDIDGSFVPDEYGDRGPAFG